MSIWKKKPEQVQSIDRRQVHIPFPDDKNINGSVWPKSVFAFNKVEEAAKCAAYIYFGMADHSPKHSLILPTDRSATLVFNQMIDIAGSEYEDCPFGQAHLISDTETFGVWNGHESSRARHINETLIQPLANIGKAPDNEHVHLLSGIYTESSNPLSDAEETLRIYTPSFHAISVSPKGEILAYDIDKYEKAEDIINNPPCILEVGDNGKRYINSNQPSNSIVSIGLAATLSVNTLVILIFDSNKAGILHSILTKQATPKIPATLLRNHHNAFILTTNSIIDEANIDCQITRVSDKKAIKAIADMIINS